MWRIMMINPEAMNHHSFKQTERQIAIDTAVLADRNHNHRVEGPIKHLRALTTEATSKLDVLGLCDIVSDCRDGLSSEVTYG